MTVNYTVKADVIDIMTDSPQKGDIFLVDTNIWYWLTYPQASSSLTAYQSTYSNYITDTFTSSYSHLQNPLRTARRRTLRDLATRSLS